MRITLIAIPPAPGAAALKFWIELHVTDAADVVNDQMVRAAELSTRSRRNAVGSREGFV
jgi:hypothetical protein